MDYIRPLYEFKDRIFHVHYKDIKINIVDTPGHADFGGEVERILKMVNGVILLVDAAEGPMPQTRFVLSKALELGHRVIVVVNKIDRPDQRIHEVVDEVLELLMDLDATPEQLDSPMLFCSGRNGTAPTPPTCRARTSSPCLRPFWSISPPRRRMWTSLPDAGQLHRLQRLRGPDRHRPHRAGHLEAEPGHRRVQLPRPGAVLRKARATAIYEFEGLARNPVTESTAGNIIAMSGIGEITIGDTICAPDAVEPIEFVKISAPPSR